MRGRILAVGGGIVAVAAGSIVAVSVTASSGGTTATKEPVHAAQPAVEAAPSPTGPAWTPMPTSPTSTAPTTTTPTTAKPGPASTKTGTITYVVKPGDNLSVISAWFHLHGYGALYDANRAVIGDDPDLIFPGERITISAGHLSTSAR